MIRYLPSVQPCIRLTVVPALLWFAATAASAADISIVSPGNEETIHDNSGNVTVTVRATLAARQRILMLLDGAPVGPAANRTTIALQGIERGEHTLQARLVDDKDAVLATSPAVTFYMWQASSQFPLRKPQPKPATPAKP